VPVAHWRAGSGLLLHARRTQLLASTINKMSTMRKVDTPVASKADLGLRHDGNRTLRKLWSSQRVSLALIWASPSSHGG